MIDPLSTGLVLDQFMGSSQGGSEVESIYQQMLQTAEQVRQQAMARGMNPPPVDDAALRRAAEQIAAGQQPDLDPQQVARADEVMGQIGMEEMAPSRQMSAWQRMGTQHQGQEVPQAIAKPARWGALADTANQAARGFGTGNLDQAIAAFAGGFGENLDERVGAGLERSRQAEQDAMQRLIQREQLEASRGTRARASRDQQMQETEFFQSQDGRQAKQKAMEKMAEEIERLAPPGSSYAAQAQAMLGDPVLYEPLEKLLDEVLSLTEGADLATKAKVRQQEALYDTRGEKFDRGISQGHLDAAREPREYAITPNTAMSAMEREIERQYDQIMAENKVSPDALKYGILPNGLTFEGAMKEAKERAREEIERRMGDVRGMTGRRSGPVTDSAAPDSGPSITDRDSEPELSDEEIVSQVRSIPGVQNLSPENLRQRLMVTTGGDAQRVEKLLRLIAGR